MKFDVIVGNPPYEGKAQKHQRIFNRSFELLKEQGSLVFIQPATPYTNKKRARAHEAQMQRIVQDHPTAVAFYNNDVFTAAEFDGILATTLIKKAPNPSTTINTVTYRNGAVYQDVELQHINMLELDPESYASIRTKYLAYIQEHGSLFDRQYYRLKEPRSGVARLQKVRGHLNKPDFFTFVSDNTKTLSADIGEAHDFGIMLDSNLQMRHCYEYLRGYVARMGLALSKFNTNNHMGEFRTVPLFDFEVSQSDQERAALLQLTSAEYELMREALGDFHCRL